VQLVPQREDFELEHGAGATGISEREQDRDEGGHDAGRIRGSHNFNPINHNRVSGRDSLFSAAD
jgi:hypothetical protein